jgi:DNA (cytosine-5)-methyltransferase 1
VEALEHVEHRPVLVVEQAVPVRLRCRSGTSAPAELVSSLMRMPNKRSLRVVGLFAGIGGIELGLHRAGHKTELLCEIDDGAQEVLRARFPRVPLVGDIREIDQLPSADLICAGFPCQDLSQAGRTAGISGHNSGLVSEVFRLLEGSDPEWVLLENVPFMLRLERGRAMRFLTDELSSRGYTWAYRIVDSRSFGLPQRRKRVVLLASRLHDPRSALFVDEGTRRDDPDESDVACGFYWTEGIRGLGWAVDAVPTLKGGSTIGIPSPPAIRLPRGEGVVIPDIRDAERLQGFEPDWTLPAVEIGLRQGARWKLVGNAVSVPMAEWVGTRLSSPATVEMPTGDHVAGVWPSAAWGREGDAFGVERSQWALDDTSRPRLVDFLTHEPAPLSERATRGFLSRASRSSLRFAPGFLEDVALHLDRMSRRSQLVLPRFA